jgi:hypothetical protein
MIELIILVFIIIFCAAITYGRGRPSGKTRITRPSDKEVTGMGGVRAYDYSYVGRDGKAFPVGLRQERKKTATFKEPRRKKS